MPDKKHSLTAVRPAKAGDAEALFALQELMFAGDVNRLTLDQFRTIDQDADVIILAAETGSMITGYIVLRKRKWRPWTAIDFIGVTPECTGQGIGGKLLNSACMFAPRRVLRLFVRPTNAAALALYARHRFRHTGTRKGSYADGEDAFVLMKWIWSTERQK